MEDSEEEGQMEAPPAVNGAGVPIRAPGMDSVVPDGVDSIVPSSAIDLRKMFPHNCIRCGRK